MTCEHLDSLEHALIAAGICETFRGKPWSTNCREWVYFDCFFDLAAVRSQIMLAGCVQDHIHRGTHDGQERGLICSLCHDAIIGNYERRKDQPVFPVEKHKNS